MNTQATTPSSVKPHFLFGENQQRLQAHIDALKVDPASMEYSPCHGTYISWPVRHEIESYQWLQAMIQLCHTGVCYDPLKGQLLHSREEDVQWLMDVANTYIKQKEAGLCCLLVQELPLLKQCVAYLQDSLSNTATHH